MRDKLLRTKSAEIQSDLEKWAKENSLLKPGEQIVFSMHIKNVPVVRESTENYLDMKTADFFTFTRIHSTGCSLANASRIRYVLVRVSDECPTMRDFLKRYRQTGALQRIPNIGGKSASIIAQTILNAGFMVDDNAGLLT